jgi:uncharacterized protein
MKNAILIPGRPDREQHYDPKRPSNSEDHWFSWLKRQLILQDILTVSIEPPMPFRPRYEEWKREFERFDLTKETILVGHSCGGGFVVRYLSEHKDLEVGRVVLVAPWINPDDDPASDTSDFFDFQIDPDFPSRTRGVIIFNSDDDQKSVQETVVILQAKVKGLDIRQFAGKGHFTLKSLGGPEFPELLAEVLKK